MPAFITFGRILFAVIFIASGASKFLDLGATTEMIAGKVVFPDVVAPYVTQLQALTGMPMNQMLAIAAAVVELLGGILIALNIGVRFFAMVLVLYVMAATFYFHDFWNQTGVEFKNNMIHALKNLSIIGGLFIIAGIGRGPRFEPAYNEV
ncbi:DoxX family protein [Tardiphaga sp.]|uniref:DoxX family protein n=1 Tax=Tardiphaga sp. TaxID=1926292 RepID=UPI00262AC21C|nr:DoxX family protein [Tardiphaga sp.]MDB5617658.1 DoxX [Tardiphaga sp.]